MNTQSTLTKKYQLVIPKSVRRQVKMLPGDKVSVAAVGDLIVIQKRQAKKSWADSLLGLGKDIWKDLDPVTYVRKERASWIK